MLTGSDFFSDGSPMWSPVYNSSKAVTIIPVSQGQNNVLEGLVCNDVEVDSNTACFTVNKNTQFIFVERAQINVIQVQGSMLTVNTMDNVPYVMVFVDSANMNSALTRITAMMNGEFDPGCA